MTVLVLLNFDPVGTESTPELHRLWDPTTRDDTGASGSTGWPRAYDAGGLVALCGYRFVFWAPALSNSRVHRPARLPILPMLWGWLYMACVQQESLVFEEVFRKSNRVCQTIHLLIKREKVGVVISSLMLGLARSPIVFIQQLKLLIFFPQPFGNISCLPFASVNFGFSVVAPVALYLASPCVQLTVEDVAEYNCSGAVLGYRFGLLELWVFPFDAIFLKLYSLTYVVTSAVVT